MVDIVIMTCNVYMSNIVTASINYCTIHIHKCAVIHTDVEPQILSFITTLKDRLADIIEPDFGLLEELLRLQVLNRRQYNKVRSGDKAAYERSDAVLDLLTTEDHCVKFLEALRQTEQQHVMNFITQHGGQNRTYLLNVAHGSQQTIVFFTISVKNDHPKSSPCF